MLQAGYGLYNANVNVLIEEDAALFDVQFEKGIQVGADGRAILVRRQSYGTHGCGDGDVLLIAQCFELALLDESQDGSRAPVAGMEAAVLFFAQGHYFQ